MNKATQTVFEQAYLELSGGKAEFRVTDALLLGANGEYFHPSTRMKYAFFILGLECGKVVARPGYKLVEVPIGPEDLV